MFESQWQGQTVRLDRNTWKMFCTNYCTTTVAVACVTEKKLSIILQIYAIFTKNYKYTLNPKALYYAYSSTLK